MGDLYDEEEDAEKLGAYMDELSHKYLALTHGTVVEFTQEEGQVGLPSPIAAALIAQAGGSISIKRTKDLATTTQTNMLDGEQAMVQSDGNIAAATAEHEIEEKTPGHLAWGAFDVPDVPIEISLVKLPKGRACTLIPTQEALQNGFYNLKDIKLVLEQSLIRTRAVLSVNDIVNTWHRGVQYNVQVSKLEPAYYGAVVCINTDITVDFAAPPQWQKQNDSAKMDDASQKPKEKQTATTTEKGFST